MNTDNTLTELECKIVAKCIEQIVVNKMYPGEDDLSKFSALMFELHKKRYNLPEISMDDFAHHINDSFSSEAIQELNDRINFAQELIWELNECADKEYLPDF